MSDFPRVTVGGDAIGGWLVEIHDGDTLKTYSPEGETAEAVRAIAWQEHFGSPEPTAAPANDQGETEQQ